MHIKEKIVDQVRVVTIGETKLDTDMAMKFKKRVLELVQAGPPNLLLNLSEVSMIDSRALGICALIYKVTKHHGEFAVCNVQKNVQTLLRMTKLNQVFLCFETEEEAITALTNQASAVLSENYTVAATA